ncbi:MAG: hypothetical protein JNJ45_00590 [Chthonomonas sp.]|nr:hypothetical protein [Chthonomonas sp.]
MQSAETLPRPEWGRYFALIGGLFVLRLIVDQIAVTNPVVAHIGQVLVTALFLIGPIVATFVAARWLNVSRSLVLFLVGVALHVLGVLASQAMGKQPSFGKVVLESLAMAGLSCWTTGLGGLVASIIKDKNLIPPIAIFLAGFDMFLIFNPTSITQVILKQKPEVFQAAAYQIPTFGIGPAAYVGPADFFIIGLLFVTIFRFDMRARATLKWTCITLLAYMLIVLYLGEFSLGPVSLGQLPALLPIGLTCLIVNWKEFRMAPAERGMTAFVAVIAMALAGYGIYRASQPAPIVSPAPVNQVK